MALAAQTSRNFAIWRSARVRSNGTEAAIYLRVLAQNRRDLARTALKRFGLEHGGSGFGGCTAHPSLTNLGGRGISTPFVPQMKKGRRPGGEPTPFEMRQWEGLELALPSARERKWLRFKASPRSVNKISILRLTSF